MTSPYKVSNCWLMQLATNDGIFETNENKKEQIWHVLTVVEGCTDLFQVNADICTVPISCCTVVLLKLASIKTQATALLITGSCHYRNKFHLWPSAELTWLTLVPVFNLRFNSASRSEISGAILLVFELNSTFLASQLKIPNLFVSVCVCMFACV